MEGSRLFLMGPEQTEGVLRCSEGPEVFCRGPGGSQGCRGVQGTRMDSEGFRVIFRGSLWAQ